MLVANRSGAVLGPHTILKEDHFPGCQSPHLPPSIPGVPNFRGVGVRLSTACLVQLESQLQLCGSPVAGSQVSWHMQAICLCLGAAEPCR